MMQIEPSQQPLWLPPRGIIKPRKKLLAPTRARGRKFPQPAVYGAGAGGGGGTPFSITHTADAGSATPATSFTFTAQPIGTADATRIVAVCVSHGITAANPVTSLTIGGSAATLATGSQISSAGDATEIWYLAVPAGTTANIVVNFAASENRCSVHIYSVVGTGAAFSVAGGTANTSGVSSNSTTIVVPAGGGVIAVQLIHNSSQTGSGSNLTIDTAGFVNGSSATACGHDTTHSGSTAFGFTWALAADGAMSIAAFTP